MEIKHGDPDEYRKWLRRLPDRDIKRVADKIALLVYSGTALTMPHVRRLGDGVCELRVDKYRLYFVVVPNDTALFLTYGEKDTQTRDMQRARRRRP